MKPNYIGIVGAIIAFISLALPWWTMTASSSVMGTAFSADVSVYPYQATVTSMGISTTASIDIWYGWAALALVILGGLIGVAGSLTGLGKKLLIIGGIVILLAPIIFAVGLQNELSKTAIMPSAPQVGLFSSGSYNILEATLNYSTYLTYGFWLALIGAIIVLVAAMKKPAKEAAAEPAPATT